MALKCLCHGTKYPHVPPLFCLLIIRVPWHKKDFSDLVPGTNIEGLGYYRNGNVNVILQTFQTFYVVEYDRFRPHNVPDCS